jgi:predicted esterase
MTQSSAYRFGVFLAVFFVAVGCQTLQTGPESKPSAELIEEVEEYLFGDEVQANLMLPTLSQHSVAEMEAVLKQVLNQPRDMNSTKGRLPSQPIQVGIQAMSYGLYVPNSYDSSRPYPVIICLHGSGFDGDAYLDRWQPRLGEDYILACPTIEFGAWWSQQGEEVVLAVLDSVSRHYHVDFDRVFLSGMSNGGIGTYLIGLNHPDRFAALVPMAGVLPKALIPLLDNAQNIPTYLIHGAKDQVMPVRFSRNVKAYLEEKGYQVVYHEHEREHPVAGGHFFPREELPDLVDWLKRQNRQAVPRELSVVRDRDHPGRAYWVRIDQIAPGTASLWASEHDREEGKRLEEGVYARLTAREVSDNTFEVTTDRVTHYALLLNEHLVDFKKPIQVKTNGRTSFAGFVKPEIRILLEEARRRPDPSQLVLSALEIKVFP